MKASDRLRELDAERRAHRPAPFSVLWDVLPLIADVVEAQERGLYPFHDSIHSTEYGELAAYPVSRHDPACRKCSQEHALTALREALEDGSRNR